MAPSSVMITVRCTSCFIRRHLSATVASSYLLQNPVQRPQYLQNGALQNRSYSVRPSEMDDPDFQKFRFRKRIFTWTLCMVTLGTVWFMKKKRKERLEELMGECQYLPHDTNYKSKLSLCDYKGCVLPTKIVQGGILKELETFRGRDNDVIVASFPKCGTTWVQELVYLISTDLDFVSAKSEILETRFPYLEQPYPGLKTIASKPESKPRFIKTHLPYGLLPQGIKDSDAKVIYIARNPKDVSVSYYHFLRMLSVFSYIGSFPEFVKSFIQDRVPYSPFFGNVSSYWEKRSDPKVLFLFYEELISDPEAVIKQLCAFLGKTLSSEEINMLISHTRFDVMSQNSSVNYKHWEELGLAKKGESTFMRKGEVGDWKNYFDAELEEEMDAWIDMNLQGSTLKFMYQAHRPDALKSGMQSFSS